MSQKILIIEDNQDNYQLVRFLLERAGYQVEAAFDGISGLQAVTEHMPDLILMESAPLNSPVFTLRWCTVCVSFLKIQTLESPS